MPKNPTEVQFQSVFGELMKAYVEEKLACGYRFITPIDNLKRLDRFFCEKGLTVIGISKAVVDEWIKGRPNESPTTRRLRIATIRRFGQYVNRMGYPVYIPDTRLTPVDRLNFTPYIFNHNEMQQILEASDRLTMSYNSPLRHVNVPIIFRLLYGCGMRISEVLNLKMGDVDLENRIVIVRDGKFHNDRLIPVAPSIAERMEQYAAMLVISNPDDYFFSCRVGGSRYPHTSMYAYFRKLLWECRISHRGRGKGPRLHDLRHTFAVHRLEKWYKEGVDLNAMLPVLAVYLGHQTLIGTQRYLRLTPSIFADITARMEESHGNIIPERQNNETN